MQVVTIDAEILQKLITQIAEIQRYVKRTSDIFTDIDNFLELSSRELLDLFDISKSTLYRWRQDRLIPFRYDETGKIMYPYKGIVEAVKNKKIQLRNMNTTEMLIRLSNIKDDIISNVGIINTNEKLND